MTNEEKAIKIASDMLKEGNDHIVSKFNKNVMVMPVEEFKSCNDSFSCFTKFIKVLENVVAQEGVHKVEFVEDSKDSLAFNMNYCIMHEIARELGNPKFCFIFCHVDDIGFPPIGSELGFQYMRSGTLRNGDPVCDFRFNRI